MKQKEVAEAAENRACPQWPLGRVMNHLKRTDSQEAGVPPLTENIHSEGPSAGPCLELRELRRMTQTHPIHRRDYNEHGRREADCPGFELYASTTDHTLPYFTLKAML